jgi:4-alpha-glucanotransferase
MVEKEIISLRRLARLYRIQSTYYDGLGRFSSASTEAILEALRALGTPIRGIDGAADALRYGRQARWRRGLEPVLIAWNGSPPRFKVRLPEDFADELPRYWLTFENGDVSRGDGKWLFEKPFVREIEGSRFVSRSLSLPEKLPLGYHHLNLQIGGVSLESFVVSAPSQAYAPPDCNEKRIGLFAPIYALRSTRNWGAGDFTDFETLVESARLSGVEAIGTLPLLPLFLDEPFDPSPYSAVSRRFWNELFIDVARVTDLEGCPAAKKLLNSADFQTDLERLRASNLIDYRSAIARKRDVLELLARSLRHENAERQSQLHAFVKSHPMVEDYAAFRAKTETERKPWPSWSGSARDGRLSSTEYSQAAKHYHVYVQWLADQQVNSLDCQSKSSGIRLYLDFPLGVNRDGYDVWRDRSVFALDVSGGAPPDGFFSKGQNWGFPPLHPEGLRRQGYRYFAESLRHHLRHADILRIDHVMGFHRLFWIPRGLDSQDGLYVHYPAEEFYAVANLESHRHKTQMVGENLGTVPDYINQAMKRRNFYGMYVGQFGVSPDPQRAIHEVPPHAIVSLNTHDTATFAGFWGGCDIEERVHLGLLTEAQRCSEAQYRESQRAALIEHLSSRGLLSDASDPAAILKAWLCALAGEPLALLLVNPEDLWLETEPQNVPGTWQERPNWRRKFRYGCEQIFQLSQVQDIRRVIKEARDKKSL